MNFQYSIIYTISIILEILIFGLVVSLSPPFVSLHFSSVGHSLRYATVVPPYGCYGTEPKVK